MSIGGNIPPLSGMVGGTGVGVSPAAAVGVCSATTRVPVGVALGSIVAPPAAGSPVATRLATTRVPVAVGNGVSVGVAVAVDVGVNVGSGKVGTTVAAASSPALLSPEMASIPANPMRPTQIRPTRAMATMMNNRLFDCSSSEYVLMILSLSQWWQSKLHDGFETRFTKQPRISSEFHEHLGI